jgi:hypothetical protein
MWNQNIAIRPTDIARYRTIGAKPGRRSDKITGR